jgi:hypothetical protein
MTLKEKPMSQVNKHADVMMEVLGAKRIFGWVVPVAIPVQLEVRANDKCVKVITQSGACAYVEFQDFAERAVWWFKLVEGTYAWHLWQSPIMQGYLKLPKGCPQDRIDEMEEEVQGVIDEPSNALDVQVGGGHYKDMAIQPIEFVQKNELNFCEGNIVKYICRWRNKNGLQDLQKVKHYVDLLIELEGLEEVATEVKVTEAGQAMAARDKQRDLNFE